ncbi:MAG: lactate dehydrogenase [Eubacteriaceae bacterium]|jgi:malate/lactate dehydrogenase|nr:lactate dehydrogenase [Eubacteriaceae bacterium]
MRKISELLPDSADVTFGDNSFIIRHSHVPAKTGLKVNVLGMGDVGGTLLLGLKILGAGTIDSIGICDLNENALKRYEAEMNQISLPDDYSAFPKVYITPPEKLFEADAVIFCATRGVPEVLKDAAPGDVRMAQFEGNRPIVGMYAEQGAREGFKGLFMVVSDPVDPLCREASLRGLDPYGIQGYGLGVMNARAAYHAALDERFSAYFKEGRVYGPHGEDLVVADSVEHYCQEISLELTKLTTESNLEMRKLGFKPYIAPAMSSGAISIMETLKGGWHYGSVFFGEKDSGAFLGLRNRMTAGGTEVEDLPLDDTLFERINYAYENLKGVL